MITQPVQLGLWKHYKGKLYRVLHNVHHKMTKEHYVVYQALYDTEDFGKHPIWTQPADRFREQVIIEGKHIPRFMKVSENEFAEK